MDILDKWFEYLTVIKGISYRTAEQYNYNVRKMFRTLSGRETIYESDILSIQTSQMIEYLIMLNEKEKKTSSSIANIVFSLKSLYKFLKYFNYIDVDPTLNLEVPKLPKRVPIYLSLNEADKLLKTAATSKQPFNERNFALITLTINCGFRVSELVNMNLSDYRDGAITVIGKGDKQRVVPLNKSCKKAVERYLKTREDKVITSNTPMFLSKRNKRLSSDIIQLIVKNALDEAGLDSKLYSIHKLRHTAATLMYVYGKVDIYKLKEILGHESIQTTLMYTHIDHTHLQNAVDSNPLNKDYIP